MNEPSQLIRAGFRFIKVKSRGKEPVETDWPTKFNYPWGSPEIADHIDGGGNIGVLCTDSLVCVDLDGIDQSMDDKLPQTYTVRSGGSTEEAYKRHKYYIVAGGGFKTLSLSNNGNNVGHIKAHHSQVVGPGSTHPSGRMYEVINDSDVATISSATLLSALAPYLKKDVVEESVVITRKKPNKSIFDVIESKLSLPRPIKPVDKGNGELQGEHPIHGSTNGTNFNVNSREGKFHCWRCESGGGILEWYAIEKGIIQCHEAKKGCLRGEPGRKVIEQARKDGLITVEDEAKLLPRHLYIDKNDDRVHLDIFKYANFLSEEFSIQNFNKVLWYYNTKKNNYCKVSNELETHFYEMMQEFFVVGKLTTLWKEISFAVKSNGNHTDYPFNHSGNTFPVKNGIVSIDPKTFSVELLPHGKRHLFTYTLPISFDKDADTKKVKNVLKQWVVERDVKELLQVPARGLFQTMQTTSLKRSTLCVGRPDSGKTTYVNLLLSFFGQEPTANISLQKVCGDKFALGTLIGKLINIHDDLQYVQVNIAGQFKAVTGGHFQEVEKKFEQSYASTITATHVFTANRPPILDKSVKSDDAWWSRWWVVVFPNSFPRDDSWVKDTITTEFMSGMLNLVIGELIDIMKTGAVPSTDIDEVSRIWIIESDPLQKFIERTFSPSGVAEHYDKHEVFKAYLEFCRVEKYPEYTIIKTPELFGRRIPEYGFESYRWRKQDTDGKEIYAVEVFRALYSTRGSASKDIQENLYKARPPTPTTQTTIVSA